MKWEDIIKSNKLQKFAKIAEDNGLYNAFGDDTWGYIDLIPIQYRGRATIFYPPTNSQDDFLTFTLYYGRRIAATKEEIPVVEFGNKQYEFNDQKEFVEVVKKYKEFAKANRRKFLELYRDSRKK